MASSLLDHLRSVFTSSAVSELAQVLGENNATTQKAVDGLIPAVTAGVINRASDESGATVLYNLLRSTPFDTDPTVSQLVGTGSHRQKAAESGNALLRQLYGERTHQLAEAVSPWSGIRLESAATLTGLVMSVLMGFLHTQVASRQLTPGQLTTLLHNETEPVRSAIPASLAALLGWLISPSQPDAGIRAQPLAQPTDDRAVAGTPWWRWALLALLLLALLFWLLRGCNRDKTEVTTTGQNNESGAVVATDTLASDLDGNELAPANDTTTQSAKAAGPEVRIGVDLPGGRKLNVAENSFNYNLAKYLTDKNRQANRLFTFDNLTFETDSARITAQAQTHVNDLIEIMKAYPTLRIRIEGNTDSTGDDAINDPLSNERAEAVKAALTKAGIEATRVTTRGLGSAKPVTTNQTTTGRQTNRRIDVVVTNV